MDAALNVKFGADTTALIAGVQKVDITLSALQNRLRALQNERLTIVDPNRLAVVNRQIDGITGQIAKLKATGTESFTAIAAKVDGVTESSKNATKGFNDAYSGVRRLANILPGIGIGGLVAVGFEVLGVAISSLIPALLGVNAAQDLVNKTMGEATGKVAGEIAGIKDLVGIVKDETATRQDRLTAFKELQDQYPNAFKNMSLEKTSLADLEGATNKLTDALIRQAQIKGLESTISKISGEINELLASSTSEIVKQAGVFGVLKSLITQGGPQSIFTDLIGDASGKLKALQDQLKSVIGLSVTNKDAELLGHDLHSGAIIDTLSKTDAALKEIIKLKDELAKPNQLPLFQRLTDSLDEDKAESLRTKIALVIRNNARDGIKQSITDKEVALFTEQLRRLLNPDLRTKVDTIIEVDPHVRLVADAFAVTGDVGPQLSAVLKKLPPLKTDIKVDPNLVLEKVDFASKLKTLQAVIAETIVGLGENIAEDLGKALAGVKDPFGDLLTLLGDGLITIGKQMIIVGGLAQLIQAALGTLFVSPGTAIVVGALAIAIGSALKSINSQKGVKAFAEGGIVTGPTNALIGEAGPEVVFPLDKLNKFIRGNTGTSRMEIVGNTIISGPNLITVFKRAQNNQGMV